nr:MAG TPA: hypothetical protein [Caudoviricetes sp.]
MRRAPRPPLKHRRATNLPHAIIKHDLRPRPNANTIMKALASIILHKLRQQSPVHRHRIDVKPYFLISQLTWNLAARRRQTLISHANCHSLISSRHRQAWKPQVLWGNNTVPPRILNDNTRIQHPRSTQSGSSLCYAPFTAYSHNTPHSSKASRLRRGSRIIIITITPTPRVDSRRGITIRRNNRISRTRRVHGLRSKRRHVHTPTRTTIRRRIQERRHSKHRRTTTPRTTTHSLLLILSQKHRTRLLLQIRIMLSLITSATNSHAIHKIQKPRNTITNNSLNNRRHILRPPIRIPLMPNQVRRVNNRSPSHAPIPLRQREGRPRHQVFHSNQTCFIKRSQFKPPSPQS